jgi:hypothetical protein
MVSASFHHQGDVGVRIDFPFTDPISKIVINNREYLGNHIIGSAISVSEGGFITHKHIITEELFQSRSANAITLIFASLQIRRNDKKPVAVRKIYLFDEKNKIIDAIGVVSMSSVGTTNENNVGPYSKTENSTDEWITISYALPKDVS